MSKKSLILTAAGGLGAIALFSAVFTVIVGGGTDTNDQLKTALSILDQGRWDVAGRIGRDAANKVDAETNGVWNYIQGVSAANSAEGALASPSGRRTLQKAIGYLEQAKRIGFPAGYNGKGDFYLGWCYYQTYRWDEAISQLESTPRTWPEKRSDALEMIVQSQLRKTPPDLDSVQQTLSTWRRIPGMSDQEVARTTLAEALLALGRGDSEGCEQILVTIPKTMLVHPEASLWRGSWRIEEAKKEATTASRKAELLNEASEIFRKVKLTAETPANLRRQAVYMSALVLRAQNKMRLALSTLTGIRQRDPQSAEAIAAALEESEILVEMDAIDSALSSTRRLLQNIEDLALYNEKWSSREELRSRLLEVGRKIREAGEFGKSIRLAEDLALAFPLEDSLQLQAEAYEQWGKDLFAKEREAVRSERVQLREQAREKHLQAGERFEQLAKITMRAPTYTDTLWRTIHCYQQAGRLDRANSLLEDYIRFEDRTKRPRGFLAMGQNAVQQGQWEQALRPLQKCLDEYPDHPTSFNARLLAAQANTELNRLDEATELLEDNLFGHKLQPENKAWRDSMFELGRVVYRQADQLSLDAQLAPPQQWEQQKAKLDSATTLFNYALKRLGEASTRWSIEEDPRHYTTRYLFARAHRLAADVPLRAIEANPTMIESAKRKLLIDRRDLLENALKEFSDLHKSINQNSDINSAANNYDSLVRNCYFGEADALCDLSRYEEAIQAYQNVSARFLNRPESLEAFSQMAYCYRKLGREADASRVLNQAKQVLTRIPSELDPQFITVTRGSRNDWDRLLTTMQSWN